MPAPGDQHTGIANPFVEPQQRISEYTAQEIATLQSRLEKQLGPEYISSRAGPSNQKVHYITAEKCIALANEVFGFNGWSSSIQNFQIDFVDENEKTGRTSIGLSVVVRVTLRDGTYHEDIGYGHIENSKGKAAAFEKAKKEGTTDALKRALRHFGNVLGNCIYDKTYLAKVTKMRVAPAKFDESCLHRHSDFSVKKEPAEVEAPKKETSVPQAPPAAPPAFPAPPQLPTAESFEDFLGELDEADFNISDEGHPDEVVLTIPNDTNSSHSNASNKSHNQTGNGTNNLMQPPARQFSRTTSAGNNPPQQPPQTPIQQAPRPNTNQFAGAGAVAQNRGPQGGPRPPQQFNQNRPGPQPNNGNQNQNRPAPRANNANPNNNSNHNQSRPAPQPNNVKPNNNPNHSLNHNPQAHMTPPQTGKTGEVGWFSARVMSDLPPDALAPKPGQAFNWKLQSPSIPRTPGVDHSASKPLSRKGQHVVVAKKWEEGAEGEGDGTDGAGGQQQQHPPAGNGITADTNTSAPRPAAGGPRPANIVNPQLSQTRRIGAPGSSSPLGNRGQFRPLTVKRPAGADGPPMGAGPVAGRVPLGDVSNHGAVGAGAVNAGGGVGGEKRDLKRQRTS